MMNVAALIYEPPGQQFNGLRREFRAEAPDDWEVRLVHSRDELLQTVADRSRHHLVILPETVGRRDSGLRLIEPIRKAGGEVPT